MTNEPERRLDDRSDCAIPAKIEVSDRLAIAVILRDLSVSGVRLQVAEGIPLPDAFDLLVPVIGDVEQRYRVEAAWRTGDMLGGRFVAPEGRAEAALGIMDKAIEGDRNRRLPQ